MIAIQDAYLRALARLPFNNAPGGEPAMPSLMPALLAAGHCFGPLPDLAYNVIVNTVWIHAASAADRFAAAADEVDAVKLDDIRGDSLAGLLALADHDDGGGGAGETDRYRAAAAIARHPNPEAFVQFVRSGVATSPAVVELLAGTSRFSTKDIRRLSALLVPQPASPLYPPPPRRKSKYRVAMEEHMPSYREWCRELAAMAMRRLADIAGGPELVLHVFCTSTNISVGTHCYRHINFMASPRDNPDNIQLYFAEYAAHLGVVLCCPVQHSLAQSGHCSGCESRRARIIHPPFGIYKWWTPFDATYNIVDFSVADLLDIKYARKRCTYQDSTADIKKKDATTVCDTDGNSSIESDDATTDYDSDGNSSTDSDDPRVLF
ncbi:hypothetical protein ACP4OV_026023 [Aristida adscensionis]